MEFCKVMNILKRMCTSYKISCTYCPLCHYGDCMIGDIRNIKDINEVEDIIIKWGEEHPSPTRLQLFYEKYPNAPFDPDGYPLICVDKLGYPRVKDCRMHCEQCWDKQVDE